MAHGILGAARIRDRFKARAARPAGARVVDEVGAPPGAQHSASSKATPARQLQALVRLHPPNTAVSSHPSFACTLCSAEARRPRPGACFHLGVPAELTCLAPSGPKRLPQRRV